ncbi:cation:proton antiporter [Arenimonas sp.]|jgi:Kef-type K+ transport system membrane component KefB|uniref:cation:proton antiporter domain-containing protein n=1 Tax=Arenimonas sp. TaxID=1872635 RepID=UPI0037BFB340
MTPFELSVMFFLQMAFILAVCRATAWAFMKIGQSRVVSEMIAGVLMGPSLMGWMFPEFSAYLFPAESKAILFSVAQLGLVLYMFLIGVEFDVDLIRKRVRSAASISIAGIVAPFLLGGTLAYFIADDPQLFAEKTTSLEAVLFMGAAMAITAFPMLARIIFEQGLTKTSLGTLALAAGSIDDMAAWCVLAVVLASFNSDWSIALIAIGGGIFFAVVCLTLVRRLLQPMGERVEKSGAISPDMLVFTLMLVMLGAWFTDYIQIYAVFGAFIMGVAMPRGKFATELHRTMYPLTVALLLPVFFVYSGLNTKIGLVNTPALWALTALVLLVAIAGKGVACYLAARLNGESHKESMAIGTLMNARGLMELIILNIGLERGIIEPTLFTIMVLMAVITTLMATPIFERIYGKKELRTT